MSAWSSRPLKFEDTSISPALVKQGYYKVGEKFFNIKINATIEASRTKLPVEWYFYQDVFEAEIKKPRLDVPLGELYRQRALQLRDKYDYLILAYSGGADSDNVLKTFTKNNIKLDEVWCDQPFGLMDKADYVPVLSTDASNMPIEWFAVIEPELKALEKSNPEIKIHLSDSSYKMEVEDYDDTHLFSNSPTAYTSIRRYRYIVQYTHKLLEKNINACLIMGIDKTVPYMTNAGKYGFVFSDRATFHKSNVFLDKACMVELFYWTPEFPCIPVQQAHKVWDVLLKTPEESLHKIKRRNYEYENSLFNGKYQMDRRFMMDDEIKKICYPWWDFSKIQVNKCAGNLRNQQYAKLIEPFKRERFYQSWLSSTKNLLSVLDRNIAFDGRKQYDDDITHCSHVHYLGDLRV